MDSSIPEACARQFRVQRLLAEGGFGAVYEAVQVELGRRVALKLLKSTAFMQPTVVERFLREARGTAAIEHPHIVRIFDHGVEDGVPWIAYEYLGGGTLSALMRRETPTWERATAIVRQICLGLEEAHRSGILHRDIKPANVLFSESGQVKLADFGLARWNTEATILTATGALLGTPYYMAPELMRDEATEASDQYAVGVLFFELLTGRRLFDASTPLQVLMMHANRPRPEPGTLAAGLPPAVDAAVLRAIAREPQARFASLAAFRAALEAASPEGWTAPLSIPTPASKGSRAPRSRPTPAPQTPSRPGATPGRRFIAPVIIVGVLALILAGAGGWPPQRESPPTATPPTASPPASPSARPAVEVDLAAFTRVGAKLRTDGDRLGTMGAVMFREIGPGSSASELRVALERAMTDNEALVRAADAALKPLEADRRERVEWPHPVAVTASRMACERMLGHLNADRARQFLRRMEAQRGGDFWGGAVGLMLDQKFSNSLANEVNRHFDWVTAVAAQVAAHPESAHDRSVWALLDVLRVSKQFSQTPVEGLTPDQLVSRGERSLQSRLGASHGPVHARLARLLPALFAIGVRGNVPATTPRVEAACTDAEELARRVPAAGPAFASMPGRIRALYPPRGAATTPITDDWPFPR